MFYCQGITSPLKAWKIKRYSLQLCDTPLIHTLHDTLQHLQLLLTFRWDATFDAHIYIHSVVFVLFYVFVYAEYTCYHAEVHYCPWELS